MVCAICVCGYGTVDLYVNEFDGYISGIACILRISVA